ncbi:MAG TPA: nucleotidyltransferase family protein [Herpetosiphonaceae bacterium]
MAVLPFDTAKLVGICRANDVVMVGVFGSIARGEATPESDIDLLVRFAKPKSLLTLVALERELATALGKPVDLVTENALHPYLRDHVLRDLQVVYDAR